MTETIKAKIGFVSGGKSSMPHYASFTPMIPKDVRVDIHGLEFYGKSLYEIANKKEAIVERVKKLSAEGGWDGVIVTAAPTEVLNPGLYDALDAALKIPFTTALHACVAALRVYRKQRVLLLTPFDARLNDLIVEHLEKEGVSAVAPKSFDELGVPQRMSGDEVFELTRKTLGAAGKVDAVYFQGAVLDPIKVLDRIEGELGLTVIASNPAMLWYVLSKLKLAYPMAGYGRLLKEWPKLRE
jgi:Arylmalonate decarboxylase